MPNAPFISRVVGVDFSGAKAAGENIWLADCRVESGALRLTALNRLGDLAGTADRVPALETFVRLIGDSTQTLWGIDFPFALPIEIAKPLATFDDQLQAVRHFAGDAYSFGRSCVATAKTLGDKMHLRRATDVETKTPFDSYHYRIICQTFHGMRDVLLPLRGVSGTIILPFDPMGPADRVVCEACPGSTLKRWGSSHNNYKQATGGPLTATRRITRRAIVDRLRQSVAIEERFVRLMMRNPGADALDAALAAAGVWESWRATDHAAVWVHGRYRREGRIYA